MLKIKIKSHYIDFLHKNSFYELDKYFDENIQLLNISLEDNDRIIEEIMDLLNIF